MVGKVKWFDAKKKYGFIKTEDREVFLHQSQIKETPKPGDEIEFDLYQTDKGWEAKNAKIK